MWRLIINCSIGIQKSLCWYIVCEDISELAVVMVNENHIQKENKIEWPTFHLLSFNLGLFNFSLKLSNSCFMNIGLDTYAYFALSLGDKPHFRILLHKSRTAFRDPLSFAVNIHRNVYYRDRWRYCGWKQKFSTVDQWYKHISILILFCKVKPLCQAVHAQNERHQRCFLVYRQKFNFWVIKFAVVEQKNVSFLR